MLAGTHSSLRDMTPRPAATSPSLPQCAAPDPATRSPGFTMPPGAVDCHAHVFGPPARYPYAADRLYAPPPVYLADYHAMHAALGVARGVLVQSGVHGTDNRVIVDALAQANGRLRAIALIDESMSDEALSALDRAGVRGFRANLVAKLGVQLDAARRLAERVSGFGWHVQFLLDIESFPALDRTLSGFPTEVVIDHMGRPDPAAGIDAPGFRSLLRFLEGGRGWAKLCAPYRTSRTGYPYADIAPFAQALVRSAPERLLWGTDWPHVMLDPPVPNTGDLAALLPNWVPEAATRKRILVDNPARLYGF
jgi:predicted TIM-barrel fold metal-dependent hydrolase